MKPENLKYHIAIPAQSQKTRSIAVVGLFMVGLAITFIIEAIYHQFYAFYFLGGYFFILLAISKWLLQLKRIGEISFTPHSVHLINAGMNMERSIETNTIKSIFVKKGLAKNIVFALKRKSLVIDILLNTEEVVMVQIEVVQDDVQTVNHIAQYCFNLNIPCHKKI